MLGIVGQLLIIASFVSCFMAGVAYYLAVKNPTQYGEFRKIGRGSWIVMTIALTGASVILSYFFFTHQFQYAYVWKESSRDLPAHFLLSAFWAGQEGSFLLWILNILESRDSAISVSHRISTRPQTSRDTVRSGLDPANPGIQYSNNLTISYSLKTISYRSSAQCLHQISGST